MSHYGGRLARACRLLKSGADAVLALDVRLAVTLRRGQ